MNEWRWVDLPQEGTCRNDDFFLEDQLEDAHDDEQANHKDDGDNDTQKLQHQTSPTA